eukprot:10147115-Heterocapsa_arctica.AAC.1
MALPLTFSYSPVAIVVADAVVTVVVRCLRSRPGLRLSQDVIHCPWRAGGPASPPPWLGR